MRVPLDALACGAPGDGDVWLMNFTSNCFGPKTEITQYAPQGRADFNLTNFGKIIMVGNPRPAVGVREMDNALPTTAVPLTAKVNIDGVLDEACWKNAEELKLHYQTGLLVEPEDATVARLAADQDNLYLAFTASERFMDGLVANAKADNSDVWDNDVVELFIDPDGSGDLNTYLHAYIDSRGFVSAIIAKNAPGSWPAKMQAKAVRGKDGWTVEAQVPFASFGFKAEAGRSLHLNLARTKPGKGRSFWEESIWSPTFTSDSHVPKRFGVVTFR